MAQVIVKHNRNLMFVLDCHKISHWKSKKLNWFLNRILFFYLMYQFVWFASRFSNYPIEQNFISFILFKFILIYNYPRSPFTKTFATISRCRDKIVNQHWLFVPPLTSYSNRKFINRRPSSQCANTLTWAQWSCW